MEFESESGTPVPMCTSAPDVISSDLLLGTDGAEVASDGIEVAVGHLPSDLPPAVTAEDCFDPYLHPTSGSELTSPHVTPSDSRALLDTWVAQTPAGMSKPEHDDLPCNDDLLIFSCIFVFFLGGAVNEKCNKKEEVQTRITNIFHVFLP